MLRFWGKQPSKKPFSCPSLGSGFQRGTLFMKGRSRDGGRWGGGHVGPAVMETNSGSDPAAARGPHPPRPFARLPRPWAPPRGHQRRCSPAAPSGPEHSAQGPRRPRGETREALIRGAAHLFVVLWHIQHLPMCPGSFRAPPVPTTYPEASATAVGACCLFSSPLCPESPSLCVSLCLVS